MEISPRLALGYIQPQQSQKHVTANENFRKLDALVQLSVLSKSISVEPAVPTEGDAYILPVSSTGVNWTAFAAANIAIFRDGEWEELAPRKGWRVFVEDSFTFFCFDGANWVDEASIGAEAVFGKLTVRKSGFAQNSIVSDGNYQTLALETYSGGASWHAPYLQSRRARGGEAAPAATLNGDTVFSFDMYGHDGANFVRLGQFGFGVGGAVSTGVVPGALSFKLADLSGVLNTVLSLTPAGNAGVGLASPTARLHVDGAVRVKSYAKAALPAPAVQGAGSIVYVSDDAGGAVLAFSDGANWRRVTDRAVVS